MEIWKSIEGCEDYEISNLGRVKSLARTVIFSDGRVVSRKEKFLKLSVNDRGYLIVSLCKDTKSKTKKVHQLVAIAFLNHTPDGNKLVIDHIDNNPLNNKLGNLQIITHRENTSKDRKGSSQYTGVSWHKPCKKWIARIYINGKSKNLGRFKDELEAAKAYQTALKEL